jgi:pilus assembly protein CpaB
MREKGVVIAASLLLGLLAAGAFYAWSHGAAPFSKKNAASKNAAAAQEQETRMVVVAVKDIPRRTKIKPEMLKAVEVPKSLAHPMAVSDVKKAVDKILNDDLIKDEVLLEPHIAGKKAPSDLTFAIPAGYRAVTIPTSVPTGVANMIRPGDFVDILLFVDGRKINGPDVGTTLLRKTLVLAVDKKLESWPGDTMQKMSSKMDNDGPEYQSVTLAVEPRHASMLVLAESIGHIKLTLHGADERDYPDSDKAFQPVFATDLLEVNGFDASRIAKVTSVKSEKEENADNDAAKASRRAASHYASQPMPDMDPLPVVPQEYLGAPAGAPPAGPGVYVMRGSQLSSHPSAGSSSAPPSALVPVNEFPLAVKGAAQ